MWIDKVTGAIEDSETLDAVGRTLGNAFGRVVRPGPVKDLLAGTPFGHPVHPTLTDVAIGAWLAASLLDLSGREDAEESAESLVAAGMLAAVPTAVTGLSELSDIVETKPRRVAALHALGNVAALALYAGSYAARRRGANGAGRGLATAGLTALGVSGFLGGHLAYRLAVGVDQTIHLTGPAEWTAVAKDADLPEGALRRVRADGVDIALHRRDGRLYAIADRCSHRGGPLHLGRVVDGTVRCPWHHSIFRLQDGQVVRGPATAPQPSYEVRVNGETIEVRAAR